MTIRRSILATTVAASTAFALAACSDAADTANDAAGSATSAAASATDSAGSAVSSATSSASEASASSAASETSSAVREGELDPAFAAISAVKAEYADGIITAIDRDDNDETFDVDVVVGEDVLDLVVNADGAITEEERENDGDDVLEAQKATVTIDDAITDALERHPEGVIDEVSLEEDDGMLNWEIDLDGQDRSDLAEFSVRAS